MIANGIFLSKLIYMISVWGNCSKEPLDCLQVIQNRAAQLVTKNWILSTKENLKQIWWLSVHQLGNYFDVLLLHQIKSYSFPRYLHQIYNQNYEYNTRQAASKAVKPLGIPRSELAKGSFRWRAPHIYNQIPSNISQNDNINIFKRDVKSWIVDNISVRK